MQTTLTENKVINLISWRLNVPQSHINPYTHLEDDLHLDAIDIMLLIVDLESKFGIYLKSEEVAKIQTVKDASVCFQRYAA